MAADSATYALTYRIGAQTTGQFYSNINKASKSLTGMGTTAKRMAGVITGALAGISLKRLAEDAVNTYQDFETSMKNTSAIAKASTSDYSRMEAAARKAGRATTKTAAESADALGYMSLAGWSVNDSIKGLMPILRLSEATGKDLKTTSDLVTDSLAAVGMNVNDLGTYMDKLVELNNDANTNAEQAMMALVRSGGAARNLTMDFDDLATSIGILANNGRKGNKAGQTMNAILTRIASNKTAVQGLTQLGVSLFDKKGNFIGFENALEGINKKLKTMSLESQNNVLYKIAGTQYMSQMRYLLDSVNKKSGQTVSQYEKLKANILDSSGALNAMNKTATSTLAASRLRLKSAYQDMQIEVVDEFSATARQAIDRLALELPKLTDKIGEFGDKHAYDLVEMIDTAADGVERIAEGVMKAGDFIIDNRGLLEGALAGIIGFKASRGIATTVGSIADLLPLFTKTGRAKYLSSIGAGATGIAAKGTATAANTAANVAKTAGMAADVVDGASTIYNAASQVQTVDQLKTMVAAAKAGATTEQAAAIAATGTLGKTIDAASGISTVAQLQAMVKAANKGATTEEAASIALKASSGVETAAKAAGSAATTAAKAAKGAETASNVAKATETAANASVVAGNGSMMVNKLFGTGTAAEGAAAKILGLVSPVGIAAASAGTAYAIYRQYKVWDNKMTELNLDKHFGDITLSLDELYETAEELVGSKTFQKLNQIEDTTKQIDDESDSIQSLRKNIDKTNWKIEMGVELNADEKNTYKQDIKDLVTQTQQWVSDKNYEVDLSLNLLGEGSKSGIRASIDSYYSSQQAQITKLGKKLNKAVNDALADGVITIDEEKSIQNIQNSIAKIQNQLTEAKFQVGLDVTSDNFDLKNGSGGISKESWTDLSKEVNKKVKEANEGYDKAYETAMTAAQAKYNSSDKGKDDLDELNKTRKTLKADKYAKVGTTTAKAAKSLVNQIRSRYSEEIDLKNYANESLNGMNFKELQKQANEDPKEFARLYSNYFNKVRAEATSTRNQKAVKTFLPELKDYRTELENAADELRKAGKKVPAAITEGLDSIDQVENYTYNANATWDQIADAYVNNPKGQQLLAIMEQKGVAIPEELGKALALRGYNFNGAADQMYDTAIGAINHSFSQVNDTTFHPQATSIWSSMKNALTGIFRRPFSVGAHINVTAGSTSENVTSTAQQRRKQIEKNIQASGGLSFSDIRGSLYSNKKVKKNARGGIYANPILTTFAEKKPEAAIPLENSSRARNLWMAAGAGVGVQRTSMLNKLLDNGGSSGNNGTTSNNTTVNATFSPNITVQGNASHKEINNALQMSYPEFRKMMNEYTRQNQRRSFSRK